VATIVVLAAAAFVTEFLPSAERVEPEARQAAAVPQVPAASPEDAERYNRRGVELAQQGDLDGAIQQFMLAIAADPGNFKSHNNLGVLYRRKGWIDEAISAYRTASEIEPKNPIPYKNLAILYEETAGPPEALGYYNTYLALAPDAPDAGIVRARVASLRNQVGVPDVPAGLTMPVGTQPG
jgi:tetratricopeptide (TPR) repeat protein